MESRAQAARRGLQLRQLGNCRYVFQLSAHLPGLLTGNMGHLRPSNNRAFFLLILNYTLNYCKPCIQTLLNACPSRRRPQLRRNAALRQLAAPSTLFKASEVSGGHVRAAQGILMWPRWRCRTKAGTDVVAQKAEAEGLVDSHP